MSSYNKEFDLVGEVTKASTEEGVKRETSGMTRIEPVEENSPKVIAQHMQMS